MSEVRYAPDSGAVWLGLRGLLASNLYLSVMEALKHIKVQDDVGCGFSGEVLMMMTMMIMTAVQ